jgi:SAM-dependent methyltransferase
MTRQELLDKHFLKIALNEETMDVYCPRVSILRAISESMGSFSGILLDVGCGQMPYREMILKANPAVNRYIGLDFDSSTIHDTSIADLHWDGKTIPMADNSVDTAIATEVLEHSFYPAETLKEIYRVLRPEGLFFFTVPFIWPLHETPYDAYRYTPFSLNMHLESAGLKQIQISSLGGWHTSFAQMMALWVRESNLSSRKRRIATAIAKRLIPFLLKNDIRDNKFGQHCMISGLYGTARK